MAKRQQTEINEILTPHTSLVLVCQKCSKKLSGGFGEDTHASLAQALKHALRRTGRRSTTRIVQTKCLGLCPRGAVTAIASHQPGRLLAIPRATAPDDLMAALLPPP